MSEFGKHFARFGLYVSVSTPGSRDNSSLAVIANKLAVPVDKIGDHLHAFGQIIAANGRPNHHKFVYTFEWQNVKSLLLPKPSKRR